MVWNVYRTSAITANATEDKRIQAIRNGDISLSGLMCEEFERIHSRINSSGYGSVKNESKEDYDRLATILKPFF